MKKLLNGILLIFSVLLFSCNPSGTGGDPKAVLSNFFDALKKKDFAEAKNYATEDSRQLLDMMASGMNKGKDDSMDSKFDKAKLQFGEPKIDGDKAVIAVKEPNSGELLNFTLKKESAGWKVAFDKATMMASAMEKMNEKGINVSDSINKAMKELKSVNMDSLKQQVQEGMRMMDSVNDHTKADK